MKKLETFLRNNPSYTKCGVEKVAERANVAVSTVLRFRKTEIYKSIKENYKANGSTHK